MSVLAQITGRKRKVRRWPPIIVILAMVVALLALVAAVGSQWLVPDALKQDLLLGISGPSSEHLLGTDTLGRDVWQLLIAGARTAVFGAMGVAIGSMLIGIAVGLPSGYLGGWVDQVAMRWADLMFSLPALLVAIVIAGVLDGGYALAVGVLAVLFSPGDARVVRSTVLEQRHQPYVTAAQLLNLSTPRILVRHILPNSVPLIVATMFLNFAFAMVSLASLSYLGLGVAAGSPDWGRTLSDNQDQLFANAWAAIAPGLAIILTAAAVNIVGDWLQSRFTQQGVVDA